MPSRIDIPLSGSAPRNGSAGLDGDVPRNAALAVRMLRYERVPVLDKQTGRPQESPSAIRTAACARVLSAQFPVFTARRSAAMKRSSCASPRIRKSAPTALPQAFPRTVTISVSWSTRPRPAYAAAGTANSWTSRVCLTQKSPSCSVSAWCPSAIPARADRFSPGTAA